MKNAGAFEELAGAIENISIAEVSRLRALRQAAYDRKTTPGGTPRRAGVQEPLNREFERLLESDERAWKGQMPLYDSDLGLGKGLWTMDFHKVFAGNLGVGLEICFNHGEAMPWTLIRPALAYQSEGVHSDARIVVGGIVLVADSLKRGDAGALRVDGAVGTYERMLTLIPRMKWIVPVPLVIFGLEWADGGMYGPVHRVGLHGEPLESTTT
ncbi:MAG: hypothetical protein WA549_01595 [Thermoplasmata archaeon]